MAGERAFEICGISARPGETARGFVTIGETASGPVQFPLIVVNASKPGPALCITAGVHATEYAPIEAAFRLLQTLPARLLCGSVVIVPVANTAMFAARSGFVSPIDGLNLNKVAPGGSGSMTELLAMRLLDDVIGRAKYYIDLHAGDLGEMLMPFGGYPLTGNAKLDGEGETLARLFTPGLISLAKEGSTLPPFAGSLVFEATRRGVGAILAESGGNGTLEERDVQVHLRGVENILRYLGMVEGTPTVRGPQIQATDRAITRATRAGMLRLRVGVGVQVAAGQQVAEICNVFGDVVEAVHVPRAGITGLVWAHKTVSSGDPVVRCWYTEPAAPFPATDRFLEKP
ncbi:MAG TPA: succinylglutamate desuccinylase/aspartoacylase family protein [Acidobacteriaceae bacterium]|nr:succinylglutamate desuccinylase/aspartoacylase family protein [Acidobacteriaceae bacterium]